MAKRNPHLAQLKTSYLFPEIAKRKKDFLASHPDAYLISLGIGDTTEPLPEIIVNSLSEEAKRLGVRETYRGYGPEQGEFELRQKIASFLYQDKVEPSEVFISDGAKCDIGRLQVLFGSQMKVAVQDPAYPVYVDGSLMQGVSSIKLLPCIPENNFFPDLKKAEGVDLLYFCSPNNPTGVPATKAQLKELVSFALENKSLIIYDTAYAAYIQGSMYPRSIFEIEGAHEVAIETGSFSKIAGFTGIRLGWTVVPHALKFEDGSSVHKDWSRVTSTIFNGASNIAQSGGLSLLNNKGWQEVQKQIDFYKENASLLKESLQKIGLKVYGGESAPYLWAHFPKKSSWDIFQDLLERLHIVATPGIGFGPSGEGFIRFSAFGNRNNILTAAERLSNF